MTPTQISHLSVTVTQVIKERGAIKDMLDRLPEVNPEDLQLYLERLAKSRLFLWRDLDDAVEQLSDKIHNTPYTVQNGFKWLNLAIGLYLIVAAVFKLPVPNRLDLVPVVEGAYDEMKGGKE